MGLPELLARLERDADARVAEIEAHARAELEALESARARASSAHLAEALAAKRARRLGKSQTKIAEARRRADGDVLRARHAVVDRAMARAAELLERAGTDETYRAVAATRLAVALDYAPSGAIVRCRPELADVARAVLAERGGSVVEDAAMPAGFVVEARDGSMRIDETLPSRLLRLRAVVAMDLARGAFHA